MLNVYLFKHVNRWIPHSHKLSILRVGRFWKSQVGVLLFKYLVDDIQFQTLNYLSPRLVLSYLQSSWIFQCFQHVGHFFLSGCRRGWLDVVQQTIRVYPSVVAVSHAYETVTLAAKLGHWEVVNWLCNHPHITCRQKQLVFDYAFKVDKHWTLDFVLQGNEMMVGSFIVAHNHLGWYDLEHKRLCDAIVNGGSYHSFAAVDHTCHNNLPIVLACKYLRREIVNDLLDNYPVDPSVNNNAALRYACVYVPQIRFMTSNQLDIVERLLRDPRVDVAACDYEALFVCRMPSIQQCLLNHISGTVTAMQWNQLLKEWHPYTNVKKMNAHIKQRLEEYGLECLMPRMIG